MSHVGRTAPEGREFLVIPIKPRLGSKQRLSAQLPAELRQVISVGLAARAVRCAAETWPPERVVVVGRDPGLDQLCRRFGITNLDEPGGGQSAAVGVGMRWALRRGCVTLATISADLPRLGPAALTALLELARTLNERELVLFPDREGSGTNGMVLRPPSEELLAFGPDSNRRHHQLAAALGYRCHDRLIPELAWDLDRPLDVRGPELEGDPLLHPLVLQARQLLSSAGGGDEPA